MADRRWPLGPIGIRLALATVAVAVTAIGVLAVLTLIAARGDVSELARQNQNQALAATATAVDDAYHAAGSWKSADLHVAAALAAENKATLAVLDAAGFDVPIPAVKGAPSPHRLEGPVRAAPVRVAGQRVGTTIVHFSQGSLPTSEAHLRDALGRTVVAGAALAALLALGVAVALSRWITRPVVAMTEAVRSMEAGHRGARVGSQGGRGELGELATAFDHMADTISREDELRRAVVADVAHELRTPLAILQAGTESLADGIVEPSLDALSSLHEEVLRLARTVDDLDTLASVEAASLSMHKQPLDLAEVAAQMIGALRPAFENAGVKLVDHLSSALVTADPHRVGQVLTNLLTNALKFTPPAGSVSVTVAADGNGAAVLEVVDTGIGIPPDELEHVFDRFWRGKETRRLAGSGIGLTVVRSLVDAHGGTVDILSRSSEGTRVRVTFPR
jgi:two-component system sensor histidine kinase BaeS